MLSDNDQISLRQIKRGMLFDLFGMGSLLLPSRLASYPGSTGIWGILAAVLFTGIWLWIVNGIVRQMKPDYFSFLSMAFGKLPAKLCYFFYGLISLGGCLYVLRIFTVMICKTLLKPADETAVFVVLLLLGLYGAVSGIEARARVYELLFVVLAVPLLVLLLLCLPQVNVAWWFPVWENGGIFSYKNMGAIHGMLETGVFFLPTGYILFVIQNVNQRGKACQAIWWTVALSGMMFGVVFLILMGIFGGAALASEPYPVITLLSMVKLPGGFLKRLDTVMVSGWFFSLYALAATALYYGTKLLSKACCPEPLLKKKGAHKWAASLAALVLLAVWLLSGKYGNFSFERDIRKLFYGVAVPYLILLPVAAWICMCCRRGWGGRVTTLVLACAIMVSTSGCGAVELENKIFPLAVMLQLQEGKCRAVFFSQKLSEVANERADGSNATVGDSCGNTYFDAVQAFEKSSRCRLDSSHTKAVLLDMAFFEDTKARNQFLEYIKRENVYARNTLLFLTEEKPEAMEKLNEALEVPLGAYLEQMAENDQDIAERAAMTLGMLLNESENKNRTLLIPVLAKSGGLPVIIAYELLQDGRPLGTVRTEAACIYYLLQNQLDTMALTVDENTQAQLTRLHCRRRAAADGQGRAVLSLQINGDAELVTGSAPAEAVEKKLKQRVLEHWEAVMQKYGGDLSDSYSSLPMLEPGLCTQEAADFRKNMQIMVSVKISV